MNGHYTNAWSLYRRYLMQVKDTSLEGALCWTNCHSTLKTPGTILMWTYFRLSLIKEKRATVTNW